MSEQSNGPLEPISPQRRKWLEEANSTFLASHTRESAGWLKDRGLGKQEVLGAQVGRVPDNYPGFEMYAEYLSIPYLAADGHVVSMRFRRPDWLTDSGPKYFSMEHEPGRIYGADSIMSGAIDLHVAEGEFDRLILKKVFGAAVGYPGATFWKPHHRVFFRGFRNVYLWGDGDEAGRKFSREMSNRIRNSVQVLLPDGQDVTDLYVKGGAEALERRIP